MDSPRHYRPRWRGDGSGGVEARTPGASPVRASRGREMRGPNVYSGESAATVRVPAFTNEPRSTSPRSNRRGGRHHVCSHRGRVSVAPNHRSMGGAYGRGWIRSVLSATGKANQDRGE